MTDLRLLKVRLLSNNIPRFLHCGVKRWKYEHCMFVIIVLEESVPNKSISCLSF